MRHTVYLAAEDEPGLAVGRKLVAEMPPLLVYREDNGGGFGTLRNKTPNFQQMGQRGFPVLMLTDLDANPCPGAMILDWLGSKPAPGFLFRVCIREVESWLLAHRSALASFFSITESHVPTNPQQLIDPKAELIRLAQKAPRHIRIGITPAGSATIGPDYNKLLCNFIQDLWLPKIAAQASPSLARARERLRLLAASVTL